MFKPASLKLTILILVAALAAIPTTGALAKATEESVGITAVNPVNADSHYSVGHVGPGALTTGGTRLNLGPCDDCANYFALPFAFPFYGVNYGSICATSNGMLLFNSCTGAYFNSLPGFANLHGIAGAWDDNYISPACPNDGWFQVNSGNAVTYRFSGHWLGHVSGCGAINFQVTLFSNGNIVIDYGAYDTRGLNSGVTVGVSRGSGSVSTTLWALDSEIMHYHGSVLFCTNGLDCASPTTVATLAGTNGNAGWYTSEVNVTLTATDNAAVAATYISVDNAGFVAYTGPVAVATDGAHNVRFYSVDTSNNQETVKSVNFKIDATPPEATITSPEAGSVYHNGSAVAPSPLGNTIVVTGTVTFEGTATDATSGVAAMAWYVNGVFEAAGDSFEFNADTRDFGTYTVELRATDVAGNVGVATMTVDSVPMPALPPL